MPVNRYGLCGHEPDPAQSSVGVEVAHVDAVDQHRRPPVTSNSRGTRLIRVVLPLPVLPMIAVVCPGRASRLTLAQHRRLGARIA